ncbi:MULTISPECIES: DUF3188 domain-containing protein [Enterococcus]|uniref:DUF5668 domain-containing protein n=1 Tax=Enterococcus diestrammenae TaxID=1155073 RepID=A0ABV0F0Y8_9ENTE|nr:DUF3188 domain-containing protein [Enterococcus diestrammenae]KAF1300351.1 hypothetical protein BAU18_09685 [Enterococcus diestrammenae]HIX70195.1 DUF3188 domain-containing protein [Candidatus Enterococcus stercoravium]
MDKYGLAFIAIGLLVMVSSMNPNNANWNWNWISVAITLFIVGGVLFRKGIKNNKLKGGNDKDDHRERT